MTYRTFAISDNVHGLKRIYRNGRQVFTARHHECWTVEQAKQLIDDSLVVVPVKEEKKLYAQTAYERWQLSAYGNVIPEPELQDEVPDFKHGEYFVWNDKTEDI
jgi:hypothetical protein